MLKSGPCRILAPAVIRFLQELASCLCSLIRYARLLCIFRNFTGMHESLITFIRERISVDEENLQRILSCYRPLKLKKNEILQGEGDPSRRMFFVVKGCLRVYFVKEDGSEVTRRIIFENAFSTSLVGFITREPSKEYTQALEPTTLLYTTRDEFYALLDTIPDWEKFYRQYLEFAYVNNTNRLMSFLTQDATTRYKQLLAEDPRIITRLPNRIVASYLNISPETLSRLKSKR
jgi:CRP-like cAMP-binding protein